MVAGAVKWCKIAGVELGIELFVDDIVIIPHTILGIIHDSPSIIDKNIVTIITPPSPYSFLKFVS